MSVLNVVNHLRTSGRRNLLAVDGRLGTDDHVRANSTTFWQIAKCLVWRGQEPARIRTARHGGRPPYIAVPIIAACSMRSTDTGGLPQGRDPVPRAEVMPTLVSEAQSRR